MVMKLEPCNTPWTKRQTSEPPSPSICPFASGSRAAGENGRPVRPRRKPCVRRWGMIKTSRLNTADEPARHGRLSPSLKRPRRPVSLGRDQADAELCSHRLTVLTGYNTRARFYVVMGHSSFGSYHRYCYLWSGASGFAGACEPADRRDE